MIITTNQDILITIFFVIYVTSKECSTCFTGNDFQSIHIKTGSSFYQECRCNEPGHSFKTLKWLDVHDQEIGLSGPGTKSNVYTEMGDHSINLHIPIMSKTLSGVYKCVSSHNEGQYVLTYDVEAHDPLYFTNTQKSQYAIYGRDALINCEARGETDPLIKWHKGQDEIEMMAGDKYEISSKGLIIRNVTDDDEGTYKCTAIDLENADEVEIDITVEIMKLPIIHELRATPRETVIVGETLSIECIAEGTPFPEYVWNKTSEMRPLEYRNTTWQQDINILVFNSIEADDEGTYECVASNKAGKDRREITIDVLVPPTITEFNNISAIEGSRVQLICKATGRPTPNITITFDGFASFDDPSTAILSDIENMLIVTFTEVNQSHDGIYICNATNEVDFVTEVMHLSILYKPYFKEPIQNIWGWEGKAVNLSCEHESNPPAKLSWRYQGNEILTEEQLDINKLINAKLNSLSEHYMPITIKRKAYYGVYECTVMNHFGEAKKIITLKEGFTPPCIKYALISDIKATSVTFTIEGPDNVEGPPILGFTSDYEEEKIYNVTDIHRNRTWSIDRPFRLEKLRPETTYYIKFAAVNEVGVGQWSDVIVFKTLEKSIPDRPIDLTVSGSGGNQVLSWKAPDHNGDPIDYYIIRYCPIYDGNIKQGLCKEDKIASTTELNMNYFHHNTSYYLELLAHNSQGNSSTFDIQFTTSEKEEEALHLSGGAIIGISVVVVLVSILVLDLMLLCWRRQGIIASCFYKKNKKRKEESPQTRDKKGLLKDNGESTAEDAYKRHDNGHKEYEYNKNTGIITGKNSSV